MVRKKTKGRSSKETAQNKEDAKIIKRGSDVDFYSMKDRIKHYRSQEAQANQEADKAKVAVQKENRQLRALLNHLGMSNKHVDSTLLHFREVSRHHQSRPPVWQPRNDSPSEKVLALHQALTKRPLVYLDIPNPMGRVTLEDGQSIYWSDPTFTKPQLEKMQASGIDPVSASVLRSFGQYKEERES